MNSKAKVHGFTSHEIAIGYTPRSPYGLLLPFPSDEKYEFARSQSLNVIGRIKEVFLQTQISNSAKRISKHSVGASGLNKLYTGEIVYFKQFHSKKWKIPGTVVL